MLGKFPRSLSRSKGQHKIGEEAVMDGKTQARCRAILLGMEDARLVHRKGEKVDVVAEIDFGSVQTFEYSLFSRPMQQQ